MDNSTAGWGKAFDAPLGWRDPEETGKGAGWGGSRTNPAKTSKKFLVFLGQMRNTLLSFTTSLSSVDLPP